MPVPDHLHHFTTIETLALILQNRTIRFKNLMKVDDKTEKTMGDMNWGKYCFVSCWTDAVNDSVAMWQSYGDNFNGVRIRLPSFPFMHYTIDAKSIMDSGMLPAGTNITDNGSFEYPFPIEVFSSDEYYVQPITPENFLMRVNYLSKNEFDAYKNQHVILYDKNGIQIKYPLLGTTKLRQWETQNEWRYKLSIMPFSAKEMFLAQSTGDVEGATNMAIQRILNLTDLSIDYFDMRVRDEVFDDIEIMMGPCTDTSDFDKVAALVGQHCPSAEIVFSDMHGTVCATTYE